ncbi:10 kDa heat shock protein, mitochondrial-like protein, partial [Euroglyphus maynei]
NFFYHHQTQASNIGRRLIPLLDRVLIERFVPQTMTKGGIVLPEKAQNKVPTGTVVATGPGRTTEKGDVVPMGVKTGDKVLLPEYGGTKVEIEDKEYYIFRDSEILGKWQD